MHLFNSKYQTVKGPVLGAGDNREQDRPIPVLLAQTFQHEESKSKQDKAAECLADGVMIKC